MRIFFVRQIRALFPRKLDSELMLGWMLLIGLSAAGFGLEKAVHAPIICQVDSTYPSLTSNSNLRMTVKAGMSCAVAIEPEDATLDEMNVILPPHQGIVVARGRTGVTYRPERTFRGEDSFAFRLHGKSHARELDTVVNVAVRVD